MGQSVSSSSVGTMSHLLINNTIDNELEEEIR